MCAPKLLVGTSKVPHRLGLMDPKDKREKTKGEEDKSQPDRLLLALEWPHQMSAN